MKNIPAPLALTMGDASGIGPEIVAKVLAKGGERVVVFGSHVVMRDIVRRLGLDIEVRRIHAPNTAQFQLRTIEVEMDDANAVPVSESFDFDLKKKV